MTKPKGPKKPAGTGKKQKQLNNVVQQSQPTIPTTQTITNDNNSGAGEDGKKKNVYKNLNRAFRVIIIFKNNKEFTNEEIMKTLKLSNTGVGLISQLEKEIGGAIIYFKYRYAAEMALKYSGDEFYVMSQSKITKVKYRVKLAINNKVICKVIEYFNNKQNPVLSMNLVSNTKFWAIGLEDTFMVETNTDILEYLEILNLNRTTIKLKVPKEISDEYITKVIKENWDIDGEVSNRRNLTVFFIVDKDKLNDKISKGFYVGLNWIVNYSWHSRQKYLKDKNKRESLNKIEYAVTEVNTITKSLENIQTKLNSINNVDLNEWNNVKLAVNSIREECNAIKLQLNTLELSNNYFNSRLEEYLKSEAGQQVLGELFNNFASCYKQ